MFINELNIFDKFFLLASSTLFTLFDDEINIVDKLFFDELKCPKNETSFFSFQLPSLFFQRRRFFDGNKRKLEIKHSSTFLHFHRLQLPSSCLDLKFLSGHKKLFNGKESFVNRSVYKSRIIKELFSFELNNLLISWDQLNHLALKSPNFVNNYKMVGY